MRTAPVWTARVSARALLVIVGALAAAGCPGEGTTRDAGAARDGASPSDGPRPSDGAAQDSAAQDSAAPDAAVQDRSPPDATVPDSAAADARSVLDSAAADVRSQPDAAEGGCPSGSAVGFQPNTAGRIYLIEGDNIINGHFVPRIGAVIFDRPLVPPYELVAAEGECAIYRPQAAGFCDPICDGYCTPEEDCLPWANSANAGPIEVAGLLVPLGLSYDGYSYSPETTLQDDLFRAGSCITATAPGDGVEGFALEVRAPPEITTTATEVPLVDGEAFTLTWTPAGADRVRLLIEVGQHATRGTLLICEGADDGGITVPSSLVDRFPYYTPGPTPISGAALLGSIARSIASTPQGPVELLAASQVALDFTHVP